MSRQIIQQPNGKFAAFSSITDTFVVTDMTEDQMIMAAREVAANWAETNLRELLDKVKSNSRPYAQFTLTWNEAVKMHNLHSAPAHRIDEGTHS